MTKSNKEIKLWSNNSKTASGLLSTFAYNLNQFLANDSELDLCSAIDHNEGLLQAIRLVDEAIGFGIANSTQKCWERISFVCEDNNIPLKGRFFLNAEFSNDVWESYFNETDHNKILTLVQSMNRQEKIELIYKLRSEKVNLIKENAINDLKEKRRKLYNEIYQLDKEIKTLSETK